MHIKNMTKKPQETKKWRKQCCRLPQNQVGLTKGWRKCLCVGTVQQIIKKQEKLEVIKQNSGVQNVDFTMMRRAGAGAGRKVICNSLCRFIIIIKSGF